ncbi:ArsJ-associated glyceraldehyde-3-phosphate dehydrogenase [Thiomicrospira sp. WB1]|uniref:ArsJ-associated glyceraldehyde-3-phosphate dehydrogenase n=1 Tax=Thiomicrospira sp. WB1 TaxID=1685380 RepID=UPI0007487A78|nr:ArsJ-associated glyceraldehyde-3-phosphate dehydrogenase [Thiomicrospira sp. WB1]KUJ71463.1 glyceraldehyde-3-phosphate dehydrogenase [Thiomicrospira sp. WB1]
MTIKVAINGFGRMGRLALREAFDRPEFEFVHINEVATDAAGSAHLLHFDSAHGRWHHETGTDGRNIVINDTLIPYTTNQAIADTDWSGADLVIEATGEFRTRAALQPYLDQGVAQVVVAAPVKEGVKNVIMGVNDHILTPGEDPILSAASCTTNCIAPVIKVLHENLGIRHGSITTLHDRTNTQKVVDHGHKDWRRARASFESLIPTTTGSAKAIADIFPELRGRLDGLAVRVPLMNASLTDLVMEVERPTTVSEVNALFKDAAEGPLAGILGYETRPLVSVDFEGERRSSVIDALSTRVIHDTQVKVYAWYDNEIGYVRQMMDLALKAAKGHTAN